MLQYPQIDPIAFSLGPLDFRWYGIAYVMGFVTLSLLAKHLSKQWRYPLSVSEIDDVLVGFIFGVVIGGRLGEVIFYHPDFYFSQPLEIFKVWKGGMSFHGGLIGAILSFIWFARRIKVPAFLVLDAIAPLVPPGLMYGRIANFINAELIGRPTDVPWAMIFPNSDGLPRHPSQLYEAFLEGLVLFLLLYLLTLGRTRCTPPPSSSQKTLQNHALLNAKKKKSKELDDNDEKQMPPVLHPRKINGMRPLGMTSGMFLLGYGVFRFVVEETRTPDTFMGIYPLGLSMGQFLCLPMILLGCYFMATAKKRQNNWNAKL